MSDASRRTSGGARPRWPTVKTLDRWYQTGRRGLVTEPDAPSTFDSVLAGIDTETSSLEAEIIDDDPLRVERDGAFRSIEAVANRSVVRRR